MVRVAADYWSGKLICPQVAKPRQPTSWLARRNRARM